MFIYDTLRDQLLKRSAQKAIHAKNKERIFVTNPNGTKTEVSPPYGALHERVMKDPVFRKKVDKMLAERNRKQKENFAFNQKHKADLSCKNGGKHNYKRGYRGSHCTKCGDCIND